MKRFLFVLIALLFAAPAGAVDIYTGYLDSSLSTGCTTAASGASPLYLTGAGKSRSVGVGTINTMGMGPWWAVQVQDLDSSQAQQALGGTISKNYDIYALLTSDTNDWTNTETVYFCKNETATATTDNKSKVFWRKLPPATYAKIYFVTGSGTTVFDNAQVRIIGDLAGDFDESPALVIDEDHSAFATTGITKFYSGATAIPVADGARSIKIIANGDDMWYTTDDSTTPEDEKYSKLTDGEWETLTPYEWERFWVVPDGDATGVLTIKQMSN